MKILLLGSGAREHAIAKKIRESKLCKELYISPANAGMISEGECVNLGSDFENIKAFAIEKGRIMRIPQEERISFTFFCRFISFNSVISFIFIT